MQVIKRDFGHLFFYTRPSEKSVKLGVVWCGIFTLFSLNLQPEGRLAEGLPFPETQNIKTAS